MLITICRLTNGKDYLGAFAGKLFVFFLVGGGKNMMKDDGNDWHNAGQGMRMTKMVDGKPTQRHAIKANVIARMDLIVGMDRRRKQYIIEQDWKGLAKLADEYFALGALTTAVEVRREIPNYTVK